MPYDVLPKLKGLPRLRAVRIIFVAETAVFEFRLRGRGSISAGADPMARRALVGALALPGRDPCSRDPHSSTLSTASVKKHDGYRLMAGGDAACPPGHPQPERPARTAALVREAGFSVCEQLGIRSQTHLFYAAKPSKPES